MIVRARSQANCSVSYKIQVIFHDKEFKNNYKNANITKIQTPYGKHHMGGLQYMNGTAVGELSWRSGGS